MQNQAGRGVKCFDPNPVLLRGAFEIEV